MSIFFDEAVCLLFKPFLIFSGPPIPQIAIRVILAAFVIEAVSQFVTHHRADRTVVHRIAGGV